MQVNSLATAASLLQQSELFVADELCLNLRGRSELCRRCQEQCHSDALQLTVDAVQLDTEACTRCGGCVPVCPAGVMRLNGFSPRKLLSTISSLQQNNQPIHLHCSRSRDSQGGIIIPCFKLFDARLAAAVQAIGICKLFLHGTGSCGDCRHGDAQQFIQLQRQLLLQWFGDRAIGLQETVDVAVSDEQLHLHHDEPELSRRNFLRLVSSGTASGVSSWFFPVADEAEAEEQAMPFFQSKHLPQQAVLYQQVLAEQLEVLPWQPDVELPWQIRKISADCSGCLSCGERCPTGALQVVRSNDEQEINFAATLCTDCELCTKICPENAIVPNVAESVSEVLRQRHILVFHKTAKCTGCGSTFIPEQPALATCSICRNEQDLDDEWMNMLEH